MKYNKFREAGEILGGYEIVQIREEYPEIQGKSSEGVIDFALELLRGRAEVLMIEDTSFFIEVLGGFPGPYASYVSKTIRNGGILKLMKNEDDRRARFETVVGLLRRDESTLFRGVCEGSLSLTEMGENGFGFDPIFIPEESNRTFAEMSIEEKNRFSHRARAFEKVKSHMEIGEHKS